MTRNLGHQLYLGHRVSLGGWRRVMEEMRWLEEFPEAGLCVSEQRAG